MSNQKSKSSGHMPANAGTGGSAGQPEPFQKPAAAGQPDINKSGWQTVTPRGVHDWNTGAGLTMMGRERQKDLREITCALIAGGTSDSVEQTVILAEKYLAEIERRCKGNV